MTVNEWFCGQRGLSDIQGVPCFGGQDDFERGLRDGFRQVEQAGRSAGVADEPLETVASGAKQAHIDEHMDLIPPKAVLAAAAVITKATKKYGFENWKGITVRDHIGHASRHIFRWLCGYRDEPHLEHALCRLMFAVELSLEQKGTPNEFR